MAILAGLMIARNEVDRYLEKVIINTLRFVDVLYVLDDNSTDNSMKVYDKYSPLVKVIKSEYTWEDGENLLREELNKRVITDCNPDWLIGIDADDLHMCTRDDLEALMILDEYDWFGFKWYDMFGDENHYKYPIGVAPRMYRAKCVDTYDYGKQKYHVFQVPQNICVKNGLYTELKIKHLGYMSKSDRTNHYERKTKIEDPDRTLFNQGTYDDILKEDHELLEWKD